MSRFPTPSRLARLSDDKLLALLHDLAPEISAVKAQQKVLWAQRIAIYQEGHRREITFTRMGEAAGVSDIAISTKLKQIARREAKAKAAAAR